MSDWPRWMELEIAAFEHGPEVVPYASLPPPTPYRPKESTALMTDKKCSRKGCDNPLGSANKSGVCTPCQQGRTAHLKRDADDAVLERVEASSPKPKTPPKPKKTKEPAPPAGPIEDFFKLTEALGLDGQEMLDGWCREWVEETRAKALAPNQFEVTVDGEGLPTKIITLPAETAES